MKDSKRRFFVYFNWFLFLLDVMITTPVYLRRSGRFVNSAFPNKKLFTQKSKFIYNKQKWKQEILRFKEIGQRMLEENNALPRAAEPPSALHAKNDTTNFFSYKLGELTENNKAPLFFSSKETI